MRIWMINHYAYAPDHFAGTRHWSLARRLIQRGHEVTVVSTSFFHKARRETRLGPGERYRHELVEGVPFLWLRTPPYAGNSMARLRNMLAFAWHVWRRTGLRDQPPPDVVLGSSPQLFGAWAAQQLARRFDVPFVLEIRDLWPETFVSLGHMSRRHPLVRVFAYLERSLYRTADRVISVPPAAADYIIEQGGRREAIDFLPNGLDLALAPPPAPAADAQTFTLMYAGAHGAANGLDVLLDAADLVRRGPLGDRVRIELMGDGPEKERLQRRAVELQLTNVTFRPPVAKQSVHEALQSADAFLMILEDSPVFRWGISPNKLFDYLGAGRPVLLSVSTDTHAIVEAGAGLTVKPGDAPALRDGIERLARLAHTQRVDMGQKGRAYVERHHDQRKLAGQLEQILVRATRQRAPSMFLQDAA